MNHILGGGFTSRLYAEVREKRGLAYSVSSSMVMRDHVSALMISTATRPEKAQDSLKIIREQVAAMATDGPTEAELAAAKNFLKGSYAVNNLDSSAAIAETLVSLQEAELPRDYIDKRSQLIDAVTLDQVKVIARKLLEAEPAILILGQHKAKGLVMNKAMPSSPRFAVAFGGGGRAALLISTSWKCSMNSVSGRLP